MIIRNNVPIKSKLIEIINPNDFTGSYVSLTVNEYKCEPKINKNIQIINVNPNIIFSCFIILKLYKNNVISTYKDNLSIKQTKVFSQNWIMGVLLVDL